MYPDDIFGTEPEQLPQPEPYDIGQENLDRFRALNRRLYGQPAPVEPNPLQDWINSQAAINAPPERGAADADQAYRAMVGLEQQRMEQQIASGVPRGAANQQYLSRINQYATLGVPPDAALQTPRPNEIAPPLTQSESSRILDLQNGIAREQANIDSGLHTPQEGQQILAIQQRALQPLLQRQKQARDQAAEEQLLHAANIALHDAATRQTILHHNRETGAPSAERTMTLHDGRQVPYVLDNAGVPNFVPEPNGNHPLATLPGWMQSEQGISAEATRRINEAYARPLPRQYGHFATQQEARAMQATRIEQGVRAQAAEERRITDENRDPNNPLRALPSWMRGPVRIDEEIKRRQDEAVASGIVAMARPARVVAGGSELVRDERGRMVSRRLPSHVEYGAEEISPAGARILENIDTQARHEVSTAQNQLRLAHAADLREAQVARTESARELRTVDAAIARHATEVHREETRAINGDNGLPKVPWFEGINTVGVNPQTVRQIVADARQQEINQRARGDVTTQGLEHLVGGGGQETPETQIAPRTPTQTTVSPQQVAVSRLESLAPSLPAHLQAPANELRALVARYPSEGAMPQQVRARFRQLSEYLRSHVAQPASGPTELPEMRRPAQASMFP